MDDTKDTKDIKETGEAASVLSVDEQMIQDGFNALLNDYLKIHPMNGCRIWFYC